MKSRFRVRGDQDVGDARARAEAGSGPARSGNLAEGVPLPKLIPREFDERPEIVMLTQARSVQAERFRRLKTKLAHMPENPPRVVVVTSGVPSEGKTTISINLALACASDGSERTLLIDADMRRPSIGKVLKPPPSLGLSEVLSGKVSVEHAVLSIKDSGLEVLPAGTPLDDPLNVIASKTAREVFEDLRTRYRWIIIDTPPILPFTDADAIGAMSDGMLVVVRSRVTPLSVCTQAIETVTSTRVLGAVLNDVTGALADRSGYYGKYYHDYYDEGRHK